MSGLSVTREGPPNRAFVVSGGDAPYGRGFSFREICALLAVRHGHARMRWHCRFYYGYTDRHLEPECDLHGIGYGTLLHLQTHHAGPLVTRPDDEGPLALTPLGDSTLDAVLAVDGNVASFVLGPEVAA